MSSVLARRLRPERLIAAGRVVLACLSLFAVWLDPTEPDKFASVAYGMMIGYVAYSIVVLAYAWRVETMSRHWPLATHIVDLSFFSLFILFTSGPGSPFNVYFVFALMCGTIRWQAKGTIVTAMVALTVFISFGLVFHFWMHDPTFDARAFVIRGTYLFVSAVLLAYLGIHEQRLLREMWLLTAWPLQPDSDVETLTRRLLGYAEALFGAPATVLIWSDGDDAPCQMATLRNREWRYTRRLADPAPIAPALSSRAFIASDVGSGRALVQPDRQDETLEEWIGRPVSDSCAELASARSVLAVPLLGERTTGHLLLLDKMDVARDDLMLAGIVASVIVSKLDSFYLNQELQLAAATEERIRLSRDLHDGVLQSLTGIGLRLAAIRAMMAQSRGGIEPEMEHLQSVLAAEQRELRFFIQDLKPSAASARLVPLPQRLSELAERVEREWDLEITLNVSVKESLPDDFCREIYHLVREALVNAARHGHAGHANVSVRSTSGDRVAVSVVDDGRGFAFAGHYTGDDLAHQNLGPKALRERVQSLSGSLTLDSGPAGVALHIVLPRAAA